MVLRVDGAQVPLRDDVVAREVRHRVGQPERPEEVGAHRLVVLGAAPVHPRRVARLEAGEVAEGESGSDDADDADDADDSDEL